MIFCPVYRRGNRDSKWLNNQLQAGPEQRLKPRQSDREVHAPPGAPGYVLWNPAVIPSGLSEKVTKLLGRQEPSPTQLSP